MMMFLKTVILACVSLLFTFSVLTSPVLAARQGASYFENLQWPFYDPDSSNNQCGGNLVGNKNEEKIFNFFLINKGLSAAQAAGAYGNIMHESSGDPENIQNPAGRTKDPTPLTGNHQGWGIIQWTPGAKIIGLAEKAGLKTPIYELGTQLELVWAHMNNSPVVTQEFDLAFYKTITDYKAAVDYFEDKIEGADPTTVNMENRYRHAQDGIEKYGNGSGGGGSISSCGGEIEIDPNFKVIKLSNPLKTPGGKITPRGITLHWWGSGSNGQGISHLVNTLNSRGLSVQIGITADGKIYQLTDDLLDLTYHAIGANSTTIGIEIEGAPDDFKQAGVQKYPQKFQAVVATVKYLVARYNLPLEGQVVCNDVSGIHPHKAYNDCPGAESKSDIDDEYFRAVMQAVRS